MISETQQLMKRNRIIRKHGVEALQLTEGYVQCYDCGEFFKPNDYTIVDWKFNKMTLESVEIYYCGCRGEINEMSKMWKHKHERKVCKEQN